MGSKSSHGNCDWLWKSCTSGIEEYQTTICYIDLFERSLFLALIILILNSLTL